MIEPICVLLVEDSEDDAILIIRQLQQGGYDPVYDRVETAEAMARSLLEKSWDVILCDYTLPQFNGLEALALYRERGLDVPFIIVSGAIGEELAVQILKAGAHDYIMKDRLQRLVPAIEREIKEEQARRERRILGNSLIASEEKFRKFFELNPAILGLSTLSDGTYIEVNPAFTKRLGWARDEVIGKTSKELGLFADYAQRLELVKVIKKGKSINNVEVNVRTKSGEIITGMFSASLIEVDGQAGWIVQINDITERKQMEIALKESEKQFRTLTENIPDIIARLDREGRHIYINPAIFFTTGLTPDLLIGKTNEELGMPEVNTKLWNNKLRIVFDTARSCSYFFDYESSLGLHSFYTTLVPEFDDEGSVISVLAISRDVTDFKKALDDLQQAEEKYRRIFENAREGIFRTSPEGKILMANQALADNYGYDSPEDMMSSLKVLNRQVYLNPADRTKLIELIDAQDYLKGYEIQQYRKDGSVLWTSMSVNTVRDSNGKILYYEGIQEDITERKMAFDRMKKALYATVNAIATLVETRDPYTAGHQRRVADLAKGIAREMGLDESRIEGIYTAAVIHDLGKVYVPAEILSKPTKLSNLEYSLIKTHAQAGYDILKDIDFPWPISRMVLEHHERLNGSGYPNGLLEDGTLIESRILSVADVVESMASHRPYRPALGIGSALEEISQNRGILYDPTAVDACLRLFNEKEYKIID
jgi:PAS domain S-box-containing protein